jgi:uncharacterized membrane protein
MSVIVMIFVVTNLPFAIGDLRLWFASITSPMTDLMFPNGMGLITLVASGVVKLRSSLPFTALEAVTFIAAIVWYFKYCRRYPQTGLILAILPLFFAWRSIFPYFFYVDIIALAYIMVNEADVLQKTLPGAGPSDNKPEISVSAVK